MEGGGIGMQAHIALSLRFARGGTGLGASRPPSPLPTTVATVASIEAAGNRSSAQAQQAGRLARPSVAPVSSNRHSRSERAVYRVAASPLVVHVVSPARLALRGHCRLPFAVRTIHTVAGTQKSEPVAWLTRQLLQQPRDR